MDGMMTWDDQAGIVPVDEKPIEKLKKRSEKFADRVRFNATNADRIRAMSDEELAEFFAQQKYRKPVFDGWLPLCNHVMGPRTCHEDGCETCWLDWLKQEVKG
jgi:hypothetical protein